MIFSTAALIAFMSSGCSFNNTENKNTMTTNAIFQKGEPIEGTNFTGRAWLEMLVTDEDVFDCSIGNVTFEAGCRNNWHSHPGGQILLVTAGEGYYQEEGAPARLIRKGDVIEIKPDVVHWHGATADTPLEHIAISASVHLGQARWRAPVSDETYLSAAYGTGRR